MSVKKQTGQCPCTALLKDGSRCGRFYKVGDPEPFCSVHRKDFKPSGAAIPRPKPVSHEERLRRFAESSDPRVAMQAIGILERRSAPDEGGRERFSGRAFIEVLTAEERERLRALISAFKELQREVYTRVPKVQPAGWIDDVPAVVIPTEEREDVPQEDPSPAVACEAHDGLGPDEEYVDEM